MKNKTLRTLRVFVPIGEQLSSQIGVKMGISPSSFNKIEQKSNKKVRTINISIGNKGIEGIIK